MKTHGLHMLAALAVGMTLLAGSVRAATVVGRPIAVSFHITYFAPDTFIPGNPVIPANFQGSQLSGQVSFSADSLSPLPPNIDIGHLSTGQSFSTRSISTDPGLLFFSFGGKAAGFTAYAYPQGSPTPPEITPLPPEIKIGALDFSVPTPPQIRASGHIVAFDDPEVVGTWDITLSAVPEPASWATMLVGFLGLGAVLRSTRRRQSGEVAA